MEKENDPIKAPLERLIIHLETLDSNFIAATPSTRCGLSKRHIAFQLCAKSTVSDTGIPPRSTATGTAPCTAVALRASGTSWG